MGATGEGVRGASGRATSLARLGAAAAFVAVVVGTGAALGPDAAEGAVAVGQPAPATVFATVLLRVVDERATELARRSAAEAVGPVVVDDAAARSAIVADVRTVLATTRDVRAAVVPDQPDEPEGVAAPTAGDGAPAAPPPLAEQRAALARALPSLDATTVAALVALTDAELDVVEREAIGVAQQVARLRLTAADLDRVATETVPAELGLRSLPDGAGERIVAPLVVAALRPTLAIDPEATAAARTRAAEAVPEVGRLWQPGEVIVRQGEVVGELQAEAIDRMGLSGDQDGRAVLRALLVALLVAVVGGVVVRRGAPSTWDSPKRLWLLVVLLAAFVAVVGLVLGIARSTSPAWAFAVPAASLAMLTVLLVDRRLGVAVVLPAVAVVLALDPGATPLALFTAVCVLAGAPLVARITSRGDLRRATLRSALAAPAIALTVAVALGGQDPLLTLGAGLVNGVVTAVAVLGVLPFLETLFRVPTVTALLDLADRNHPLLRRLETEAIGTYNHAVLVASLTERACRAIGADPLLGSVAALYHDIGKVRRPQFFIENQQGIANPHDDLDPVTSAGIIHRHVLDGLELATEHRLPPEVIDCIGSHHGTMVVGWFHDAAERAATADGAAVDDAAFRYPGRRPTSREAAVLMLADASEATTRAEAMERGTIPRERIEATVDRLVAARLADGQLDEAELTLSDLSLVRDELVAALVGIYHPRIAYPGGVGAGGGAAPRSDGTGEVAPADGPAVAVRAVASPADGPARPTLGGAVAARGGAPPGA